MDDLLGALFFLAFLFVCWLIYLIASNSWPVCGLLVIAAGMLIFLRKSENPWAKAGASIARACTIGFGTLTVCLLVFNGFISTHDLPAVVSSTEKALIRLSLWLPAWAEPTVWQLALVLMTLVVINRIWPSAETVSTFLTAKTIVSRVTAGLAIAASFSFFGSEDVLGSAVREPMDKLSARYVGLQEKEIRQLERYLLLRGKAAAVKALPMAQQQSLAGSVQTLASIGELSAESRLDVARLIAGKYMRKANESIDVPAETIVTPRLPSRFFEDPDAADAAQRDRVKAAERLVSEAERAYEEVLSETISQGTTEGVTIAHAMFDMIFDAVPIPLSKELASLLEKVADEYVSQRFEPLVKRCATELAGRLHWDPPPDRPGEHVGVNTVRNIVQEQLETANTLARRAVLPKRDVPPVLRPSTEKMLITGPDGNVIVNPKWRYEPRLPAVKPPVGISEQAYTEAMANADRAAALLAQYGRVAAPLGIVDPRVAIESALRDAREVLNLYEPTFTAIAQRREAEQRRIAEESREREYREMRRVERIEARPRAIP